MAKRPRFPVGTQFLVVRGKTLVDLYTITDILQTYNLANELVRVEYVATKPYGLNPDGVIRDTFNDTAVARGIWELASREGRDPQAALEVFG